MNLMRSRDYQNVRMAQGVFNVIYECAFSVATCLVLSILYVASFYVWNSKHDRNHPTTIKKRFISVFIMMFISPIILYKALNEHTLEKATIWEILGLRLQGIIPGTFIPLFLTMVLFLGPLTMHLWNVISKIYNETIPWSANLRDLIWWRNHIVAPLSEEFTFRSCMLPALLQCFPLRIAVFISPLFFGIAHFHHVRERVNSGLDLRTVMIISCFQFFYTTIFGAYSAYLFARTGHLVAPFIAHAFCNYMGFPDINELVEYDVCKRNFIACLFLLGFTLWCMLLDPLTNPTYYSNNMYWKT